ncbi:MAG: 50S ribosomal protein L19 [Candidatus Omnitrophica bacterium]|nr:50S ribosomal protein L19 [Candidatus Omnitrophota bacterium]
MDKIKYVEAEQIKKGVPEFRSGDTVRVYSKIQEEGKSRLQAFEGMVIRIKGSGIRKSFTVRRISYGEGVERTFVLNSPMIDSIRVMRKGKVKRAKLYYLRKKIGKKTKIEGEDVLHSASEGSEQKAGEEGPAAKEE